MIDSTDAVVIEESLKRTPGKSIINSINLEDGEERFERVVPLARRYRRGAGGRLHRRGQAAGAGGHARAQARRSRSARSSCSPKNTASSPRTSSSIRWFSRSARATRITSAPASRRSRASALIKQALPQCKTVLGISNVSFGLPEAGREVLNSVMLYHCVQAGLDLAIVNSEKLERYPSIPEEERRLAEDLIWWRGDDPIAAFAAHFRERKRPKHASKSASSLPLDERLALYILEGSKDGLIDDLERSATARARPLEIINGPLMKGMDEVGRLFNANQMIVAEVLQSAEAMKAAVAHLEPHMEKAESAQQGHDRARHGQGRRSRHRQEPGRDHPRQQRLPGRQPRHQGAARGADQGVHASISPTRSGCPGLLVKSAQMMVARRRT